MYIIYVRIWVYNITMYSAAVTWLSLLFSLYNNYRVIHNIMLNFVSNVNTNLKMICLTHAIDSKYSLQKSGRLQLQ